MVTEKRWALGSNQYKKRLKTPTAPPENVGAADADSSVVAALGQPGTIHAAQLATCGVTWDTDIDVSGMTHSTPERVLSRFRAMLAEHIWNTASLEGNNYTLPQVRTLLDGVTIGGQTVSDTKQILALKAGYDYILDQVETSAFTFTKATSDNVHRLHRLVGEHEAIETGMFRGEGVVDGGGTVRLANGGVARGLEPGPDGRNLKGRHKRTVAYLADLDPRTAAVLYFAAATRTQYYFDGNKRTARLMASGLLLSHGYDALVVEHARRFEYNTYLDELFTTDDATPLARFLISGSVSYN